ncbi:uncharacterized protein LOC124825023 [Vigna umbellata]|uniref:uncharacterized protein LOC124825023 n=1 Tax=Vigna umbellata TaxID=87088 RepID=UPI001F5EBFC8|nr:uncharacterized protein LOC124825023 [Vigna umbellata]
MDPRPFRPISADQNPSDNTRLLESVIEALQQQNAALVQQNTMALQSLEAARANSEATQRQLMEIISTNRNTAAPSSSTPNHQTEWSLESFLQHHPAKFNGKFLPDEADQWLHDMERIYNAKRCPEDNRLAFTEYLLTRETNLCIKSFPTLVERAKVLEKNVFEVEQQKKQQQKTVRGPISSRNSMGLRKTPYTWPSSCNNLWVSSSQLSRPVGPSRQQGSVVCFICEGPNYKSPCPQLSNSKFCVRCNKNGHWEKECNLGRRAVMRSPNVGRFQYRGGGRAQAVGRVYAITGAEAPSSAREFRTSTVCIRCPIEVEGRIFKVNLICLPLQGLKVILGMDWLAANHILIDCGEKKVIFPSEEEELSLTVGQLRIDIMEGVSCFLVMSHVDVVPKELQYDRSVNGKQNGDRSVVNKFMDVFPKEVPRLPPQREVEFSIDLVSGAGQSLLHHTKWLQQS